MILVMLRKGGYEVYSAPDALSGLRTAYQTRPHAIILDVMMPEMDGFEACRRLREMTDAPILFLTGKATTADDVVKGLDLGADEYMTKPFRFAELLSRLRVCLRRADSSPDGDAKYISPTPSVILDCARRELTINGRAGIPDALCRAGAHTGRDPVAGLGARAGGRPGAGQAIHLPAASEDRGGPTESRLHPIDSQWGVLFLDIGSCSGACE